MEGLKFALGVIVALVGVYGLYIAATGRLVLQNPVTRFLFAVSDAEPSRPHTALSSGALVAFGVYWVLSSAYPGLPLWAPVVAMLVVCALLLAAHLQRDA